MRHRDERPGIVKRALEARDAMAANLTNPNYIRRIVTPFLTDAKGTPPEQGDVDWIVTRWASSLRVGEVYAVAPEMHYLVEQAGADLPDDYVIEHHHLHAEHGFLYLPENIIEVVGMPVSLLTWHAGAGVTLRGPSKGQREVVPGLELNLWYVMPHSSVSGVVPAGEVIPVGSDFLPWGMPSLGWWDQGGTLVRGDQNFSNAGRYVIALQMIMRQELPALNRYPVPKASLRGLRRLRLPENDVTVIALRRRAHHRTVNGPETGRHQTVRSVVRGHWRRFHVGPTHPQHPKDTESKVAVWKYVNPFWRGPEDGPLKVTPQRVHVVAR